MVENINNKNKNQKKAQISMFVILAIVLVVVGVVYFIFSQTTLFQSPQDRSQEQISEIIRFCVGGQLENSIKVLQFKGGRINTPPYEDQKRVESFDFDIYSWDQVITLEEMQNELETEVRDNSIGCLISNLKGLDELYIIEGFSEETFQLDVTIQQNQVDTLVEMPLSVSLRNSEEVWEYSSILLEQPSALFVNYELAKAIFLEHKNNLVFEDLVLQQISAAKDYSDPTTSVPTQGIDFSCSTPVWRAQEIQNSILSMNDHNFHFLQFAGTKSIENRYLGYDDDIVEYYQKAYTKELEYLNSNIDFSNLEVDVVVPKKYQIGAQGEDVYLSNFRTFLVNGENEQFISPKNMKFGGAVPIPCVQVYSKVYDLDYDILVEIESFENSQLEIFRLPIRIQIEDNEPKTKAQQLVGVLDSSFDFTRTQQALCSDEHSTYEVEFYTFEASSQGLSPLYGVDVAFNCAGILCRDIGEQSTQLTSAQAFVDAKIPFCSRGKVEAEKNGYFHVDTQEKLEVLDLESVCGESYLEMNELDFNGRVPYIDICLIKEKNLTLDVNSMNFFNIETAQTLIDPKGEFIIRLDNAKLEYSSFAYVNFKTQEMNLQVPVLATDSMLFNISMIYYEDDELRSYYLYENQEIRDLAFLNTLTATVPILNGEMEGENDYIKISNAYTNGFLDVGFGYSFN